MKAIEGWAATMPRRTLTGPEGVRLFRRDPAPPVIAKRLGVTRQRVHQVIRALSANPVA
jgi:hypothetical protein